MMVKMIENLKISIKGIHIRFEDTITQDFGKFSCGVCLESIEIYSK